MERMKRAGIVARGRIDCFTERAAGLAALEEAVLDARSGVRAVFDALDPELALVSARARRFGQTWFDLILHTLGRGVTVSVAVNGSGRGGGATDRIADLVRRIDAQPHVGRRCGDLSLSALMHPAFGSRSHPEFRTNLAVIDDRTLFVARQGLVPGAARDLSMMAHGPVVAEGVAFLDAYAGICAGTQEPPPARRLLRTLSQPARGIGRLLGPRTVANEIESAHHMLIRRSSRLIYIETQRFDSLSLAEHLARRAEAAPALNLILILPAPAQGRDAVRSVRRLARSFGERLFLGHAPGGCTNISVFDDQMAIGGSVDLDARGLRADAGVSLYLRASDGVEALRLRLARHWLAGITQEAGAEDWRHLLRGNAESGLRTTEVRDL